MGHQSETKILTLLTEVHPQLSHNGHPVDSALAGADSSGDSQHGVLVMY
jgi:hypothetical protein